MSWNRFGFCLIQPIRKPKANSIEKATSKDFLLVRSEGSRSVRPCWCLGKGAAPCNVWTAIVQDPAKHREKQYTPALAGAQLVRNPHKLNHPEIPDSWLWLPDHRTFKLLCYGKFKLLCNQSEILTRCRNPCKICTSSNYSIFLNSRLANSQQPSRATAFMKSANNQRRHGEMIMLRCDCHAFFGSKKTSCGNARPDKRMTSQTEATQAISRCSSTDWQPAI